VRAIQLSAPLPIRASAALALAQRPQVLAVGDQRLEGHVGRSPAAKHQLVEQRPPSVMERHQLAVVLAPQQVGVSNEKGVALSDGGFGLLAQF
jgi:hypothetical protein